MFRWVGPSLHEDGRGDDAVGDLVVVQPNKSMCIDAVPRLHGLRHLPIWWGSVRRAGVGGSYATVAYYISYIEPTHPAEAQHTYIRLISVPVRRASLSWSGRVFFTSSVFSLVLPLSVCLTRIDPIWLESIRGTRTGLRGSNTTLAGTARRRAATPRSSPAGPRAAPSTPRDGWTSNR